LCGNRNSRVGKSSHGSRGVKDFSANKLTAITST
jgi:hypothetical protein